MPTKRQLPIVRIVPTILLTLPALHARRINRRCAVVRRGWTSWTTTILTLCAAATVGPGDARTCLIRCNQKVLTTESVPTPSSHSTLHIHARPSKPPGNMITLPGGDDGASSDQRTTTGHSRDGRIVSSRDGYVGTVLSRHRAGPHSTPLPAFTPIRPPSAVLPINTK